MKSIKITEEIGYKAGLAPTYNNIGSIHKSRGDLDQALDWFLKSLKIREEIGDKAGLATNYNNIGGIYKSRGEYDQALHYGQQALSIFEQIGVADRAQQVRANIETLKAEQRRKSEK